MKEIKAYCRKEKVAEVVQALRDARVPRMTITHVHSLGRGVDPKRFGVSWETGTFYTEHAKLELVCAEPEVDALVAIIQSRARTGEPGDGIVLVSQVDRAVKIRTGVEGREALR